MSLQTTQLKTKIRSILAFIGNICSIFTIIFSFLFVEQLFCRPRRCQYRIQAIVAVDSCNLWEGIQAIIIRGLIYSVAFLRIGKRHGQSALSLGAEGAEVP